MKRSDHVFVYYNPDTNKRYCRICAASTGYGHPICDECVKKDRYICCSYSTGRIRWTEDYHFDNTKHTILLSTSGCILKENCHEYCELRAKLKDLYKLMESVEERK